jgi:hypothetical protein
MEKNCSIVSHRFDSNNTPNIIQSGIEIIYSFEMGHHCRIWNYVDCIWDLMDVRVGSRRVLHSLLDPDSNYDQSRFSKSLTHFSFIKACDPKNEN